VKKPPLRARVLGSWLRWLLTELGAGALAVGSGTFSFAGHLFADG